ncbi:DUF4267 domain-containing protein [Alloacidobacterium dinghuense]|uniref:DUF4267 domain-containing protein n=1 Tax=Alloacidobacterium dinghuense TaxID=2763107 RepID=A0A7G8BNF7_9BACT|nr:DUF4267 domain-containing protein [Alloacidobacterium dinghuense]QNI34077.1 DUF4267 domain-containing protein [Alloacidobacterium dinghuense]
MKSRFDDFTPRSPFYWLSGVLAVGIFLVGLFAMLAPATGSIMFGMPAATDDALPWIRLAGVRDIALGLVLFATIALKEGRTTGLLILLIIVVPIADVMTVFLRTGVSYHILIHGGAIVYMAALGTLLLRRR